MSARSSDASAVLPFLKWPGGKRWIAGQIAEIVDRELHGRYFEPFLGGGAVYFRLLPESAVLSDINRELIDTYRAVRDHPNEIVRRLKKISVDESTYYRLRSERSESAIRRATRFLYLNRTAFGGLYRLNARGEFNVPFGGGQRTPAILWERGLLEAASSALQKASLRHCDFESQVSKAERGDVVYCDPTYTVAHANNGFVRYNERVFRWRDQVRLSTSLHQACSRGATVLLSNADHPSVRKLYPRAEALLLARPSAVSTDISKRGPVSEVLLILRPSRRTSTRVSS